jgi:hypothetical protein
MPISTVIYARKRKKDLHMPCASDSALLSKALTTLSRQSNYLVMLTHDYIHCDSADYDNKAGFCAFDPLVEYPDSHKWFAAAEAATRNITLAKL